MSISIFLVACCVQAAGAAYPIYVATLNPLGADGTPTSDGVSGEVTVFVTPTGLLGVGSATGFAAGYQTILFEGTSCQTTALREEDGAYVTPTPKVGSYFSNANGAFSFSETTTKTAITGKPFVVKNSTGFSLACGTLAVKTGAMSASLAEAGTSGVVGELTIYATSTMIIGAGRAIGLEASLTETNAGRMAVNLGSACTNLATTPAPWSNIGYGMTTSAGSTDFIFSVTTSSLEIANKPFTMSNTDGAVVACGHIGAPYSVFSADLQPVATSGVTGEVTVFVSPDGLLGVGSASGLQANVLAADAGGVHIHSGSGCSDPAAQGGHYQPPGGADPWASTKHSSTNAAGNATWSFSVKTLAKDILDKPFIVHQGDGTAVACGKFVAMTSASTATLAEVSASGVTGVVTIYTTATKIIGAGGATGLAKNLATNAGKVAVINGGSCANAGTKYLGTDPWAQIGYSRTDSQGAASFVFSVPTASAADVKGKAFTVYDNAGVRKACGVIPGSATGTTTGSTTGSTTGTAAGTTTGTQTTSDGYSVMPALSTMVVLFARMFSICPEF